MVKWIIIAVLLLPVAELATFVAVALLLGWGWAFLLMAATTITGFLVLKQAGRGRLANFGSAVSRNDTAAIETNTGSFLAILGGILLFLPGFLTDLAGAALLLPPVRRACAARFRSIIGTPTGSRSVLDLEPDQWRQTSDRETPREPDQLDRH
jgi:UPF0716 protein FxsA